MWLENLQKQTLNYRNETLDFSNSIFKLHPANTNWFVQKHLTSVKHINHRIEHKVIDWSGMLNCSKYKIIPQHFQ